MTVYEGTPIVDLAMQLRLAMHHPQTVSDLRDVESLCQAITREIIAVERDARQRREAISPTTRRSFSYWGT